jgi:CRISPR-associated protein Cas5t
MKTPVYQLVLGRMNDLATVEINSIIKKDLEAINGADKIRGQIIPLRNNYLPGVIQALPKYFSNSIPRYNIGTEAYSVISHKLNMQSNLTGYRDKIKGKEVDIYMHELDF